MSAIDDCTARRVWNVKRASFYWGSVRLGQNFTGAGSSPAIMLVYRSIDSWLRYNFAAGSF